MTQPELRSKSEIRKRHNHLKQLTPVPTPHDDRGVYNLNKNELNVGYPQGDTDLVKLDADSDVDVELLIEQINTSYKAIAEAHHHLLNGPEQHED